MAKPVGQRNQTDTAKRKLKSLAKANGLDVGFVTALANFTWDYDPQFNNEATGWVSNKKLDSPAEKLLENIAATLGLPRNFELTREAAAKDLLAAHRQRDPNLLWSNFAVAAAAKHYGHVSEFASYFYLRGLNRDNARFLDWKAKKVGILQIARNLFLKHFRGGAIERYDLAYLWCDLVLTLPYQEQCSKVAVPVDRLLDAVESLPRDSGLRDLLACCKGIVGGDKFFKQEVLQSLAYADVLRVNGLSVTEMFLAERRNELSPHFYSNEWTFPLRFWSANGGSTNRSAIPRTLMA
jgi:hypothetical protein